MRGLQTPDLGPGKQPLWNLGNALSVLAPSLREEPAAMKTKQILLSAALSLVGTFAFGQNTIYSYAIGNWRNGPTVEISPVFKTTEMFTTPQLISWVRAQWPESFTDTTDIDVQRFAGLDEGNLSRTELKAKYARRKLPVHMIDAATLPSTPDKPEPPRKPGTSR
jgi:hypothetical protein